MSRTVSRTFLSTVYRLIANDAFRQLKPPRDLSARMSRTLSLAMSRTFCDKHIFSDLIGTEIASVLHAV